jgi:hypothetical protein
MIGKNQPKAFPYAPTALTLPNFAIPTTKVVNTNGDNHLNQTYKNSGFLFYLLNSNGRLR